MIATATQNCRLMDIRRNTLSRITGGTIVYIIDGKTVSQQEFDERYPVPTKIIMSFDKKFMKGEDLDGTRKWIHQSKK